MKLVRVHVLVSGRVQGVGFRESTQGVATENEVTGWVRNLVDGRVEAILEGSEENVLSVLAWMRKGPALANVSELSHAAEEFTGSFSSFTVERGRKPEGL